MKNEEWLRAAQKKRPPSHRSREFCSRAPTKKSPYPRGRGDLRFYE